MLNLCNLHQILKILKRKVTLVAYLFSKLPTVKATVTQMFKYHHFIPPFYGQRVKQCKTLAKSPSEYFYKILLSLWVKLAWKNFLLLIFKLLRVFINTFTDDHKYSFCYIQNHQVLYKMQLCEKLQTFSGFFSPFLKSPSNFENFQKKRWHS